MKENEENYTPNIPQEKWNNLVKDKDIFTENSLIAFACLKEAKSSTCTDLAKKIGRNKNFYNNNIWQTGERIFQETKCSLSKRSDETERYRSICCEGKELQNNRFEYKIRDELLRAFEETGVLKDVNMYEEKFTWIPFYKELAQKILSYKNNHKKLLKIIKELPEDYIKYFNNYVVDIHPFFVFGIFNRGLNPEKRNEICIFFKEKLNMNSNVPSDFSGIPTVDNRKSWWGNLSNKNEVDENWALFEEAIKDNFDIKSFKKHFDSVENQRGAKWSLTMGLFWVYPERFIALDSVNRNYLNENGIDVLDEKNLTGEKYIEFINFLNKLINDKKIKEKLFPEISYNAWKKSIFAEIKNTWLLIWNEKKWDWQKYDDWCAGTKNGETYTESWTCKSKQPKIGDHVFLIKLGEEPRGIIAHGFVSKESYETESYNNEKITSHIDVEFDLIRNYKSEDILNIEILKSKIPNQNWSPQTSGIEIKENNAKKLLELWNELNGESTMQITQKTLAQNLADLLKHTRNLILHGAPGTGKTHLAHEIAEKLGCTKDEIGFVQFHPSYDYTDFVEGLRPVKSSDGTSGIGFERRDGVFKEFCKRALKNPENNFLFIIDEINRGELSKIFGELFYAIESGYRGEKGTIQTQYQNLVEDGDVFKDGFFVPENVYIIGTMNDIDRSVDTMDFAFRRRFTFYEIEANYFDNYDKKKKIEFDKEHLGMFAEIKDESIRETAIAKMKNLNNAIWRKTKENENDNERSIMDSSSYHIGGAYFLKLNELDGDFDALWNYHLSGLLREYLRGRDDAEAKLAELKNAYDNASHSELDSESVENDKQTLK